MFLIYYIIDNGVRVSFPADTNVFLDLLVYLKLLLYSASCCDKHNKENQK